MKTRKLFRDGLEEEVAGDIETSVTRDGHTVERYTLATGETRYFVTLAGTHWCAHGNTIAAAVCDATWKDPERRPSLEALVKQVQDAGREYKITLSEFRVLTGACIEGCRTVMRREGIAEDAALTATEIKRISPEWGGKLLSVLGWDRD